MTPSIDAHLVTRRTFLSNFTPIRFETTEPWAFLTTVVPTKQKQDE